MQIRLLLWSHDQGWRALDDLPPGDETVHLVLYFGAPKALKAHTSFFGLKELYPVAHILGCSTGGEILNDEVLDDALVAVALRFDQTRLMAAETSITGSDGSFAAGQSLARTLQAPDLRNIFLLSDGLAVNGSELVRGLYSVIDPDVVVTGGLAGDGAHFQHTLVGLNAPAQPHCIGAVGFYGNGIRIGYGSVGGWEVFGPDRVITRASGNVLYELDGAPALDLYKAYLGEKALELPSSGLLFPLSIRPDEGSVHTIVRTIIGVDENTKSMTFAGDIPEGYIATLMRGHFDGLIDGAAKAAGLAFSEPFRHNALAILVSCIGRKLLLGQRISDETEAVAHILGAAVPMIGFYSYGEIGHQEFTDKCGLHNQTMTITMLAEA